MLISNSHKFIFVHITKAAGTSVTLALDKTFQWNDLAVGGTPLGEKVQPDYVRRFGLRKHSTAQEIRRVVGDPLWNDYFTFTFVRHPYGRVVSLYTFVARTVRSAGWRRRLPLQRFRRAPFWSWPATLAYLDSGSFSEFIRHPELVNHDPGMRPQVDWICDERGDIDVDFVGKVENIDQDFAHIAGRIGMDQPELGTHNTSNRRPWTEYLSSEADFAYLHELFRKDFDVLGYDPELR